MGAGHTRHAADAGPPSSGCRQVSYTPMHLRCGRQPALDIPRASAARAWHGGQRGRMGIDHRNAPGRGLAATTRLATALLPLRTMPGFGPCMIRKPADSSAGFCILQGRLRVARIVSARAPKTDTRPGCATLRPRKRARGATTRRGGVSWRATRGAAVSVG